MMNGINAIFCWLGGVIVSTIPDIVAQCMHTQTGLSLDFWKRAKIQDLSQDLMLGQLNSLSFCERVVLESETSLKAMDLEHAILELAAPRLPVLEVLAELPSAYPIWLVADYPPDWFTQISREYNAYSFINADRLIFTADCQLTRLIPDVFYLLARKANLEMNACMMVTGNSTLSVEAVKHGLTTEIFIDAFRLRRSFVLRKMLPGPDPRSS
jgi:FMN phosphatase YigB (HAD superfamily)